jgi:hypothetical protein
LGLQAGRLAAKHHNGFEGLVRRTLPGIAILVVMLGLGLNVWQRITERRALTRLNAADGAPNVVLLILDTVRAMNLALLGYDRPTTPNIERLAKRGVTFEWSNFRVAWTLPSTRQCSPANIRSTRARISANTRRSLPYNCGSAAGAGVRDGGFRGEHRVYRRGHRLGARVHHYEDYIPSIGHLASSSSLIRMLQWSRTLRKTLGYYELLGRKNADEINTAFLDWQGKTAGKPFFAFLNYFDAHAPYLPPEPYDTLYGGKKDRHYLVQQERYVKTNNPELQPYIPSELSAYDASITALDEKLGRLFDELESRGLLENTIIILTSDHGEEFGEHGIMGHAYNLNTTLLHVPLVMVAPKRLPAATRVSQPVSLRDLPATILDLAGAANTNGFPGRSLVRNWQESPDTTSLQMSSEGEMVSLIGGQYHYIRLSGGQEQLFNYVTDRYEQNDIIESETGKRMRPYFRGFLPPFFAEGRRWTTK